ncbi:MAG: BrxA/BrxB family bacilliredoxin [Acidobacteriaceae bacterium]|nr:BrxA/BrxB family bacilliredoxin [Acidobacteriaceae bacterium]MBV9499868.1 BrxA/BrxB family bacilliredoxin [Acidobacteriaceae bacterium]
MFSTTPTRYPERLIAPMREDLTQYGVREARTHDQVDQILGPNSGTVLMIVNSVCGCAAGKARPAVGLALEHPNRPETVATVFAGADLEAVARVRELLPGVPPSSPSMSLFRDGKPVFVLHRFQIESSSPESIAKVLTGAFDQYCVRTEK